MSIVKLQAKKSREKYVSYLVTIPSRLVELLGWRPGDKLLIELKEEDGEKKIVIKKVEVQ